MSTFQYAHLPQEVWENICSYLNTSDVINLCSAFPEYNYFLRERSFIKYFDVSGNYDFAVISLSKYIVENVSCQHIKSLNINKMYWIELKDLRKLVKNLPNLEELFALNTKLALRSKDIILYGNLRTLAVTVHGRHFADAVNNIDPLIYKNNLYLLKRFCIHVASKHTQQFLGMSKLFSELFALQELWIYDSDDSVPNPIKYDSLVIHLKFLKKLVIKSSVNIPFLDYKPFGLAKYFESRRFKSIVMAYERLQVDKIVPFKDISLFEPYETKLEEAWEILRKYRSEMPYDPKVHREIYLTKQIKNVKFDELNFFHNKCFCTQDYVKATLSFLLSENSRTLRKLSIKSCVLQRAEVPKENTLARLERKYPILEVIENCPNVSTFELMQCPRVDYVKDVDGNITCNVTILEGYSFLNNWRNLERFTLEVPPHLNGKFLVDLLISCTKLKFLRIISYNTNENLNRHMYQALPYATHLEDFCYENKHINLDIMLRNLAKISSRKLRRIYINCEDANLDNLDSLNNFLSLNPQLIIFYLVIQDKPKNHLDAIQQVMNEHQRKEDFRCYCAKRDTCLLGKMSHTADVNKDLFSYDTEVSGIDFYNFR